MPLVLAAARGEGVDEGVEVAPDAEGFEVGRGAGPAGHDSELGAGLGEGVQDVGDIVEEAPGGGVGQQLDDALGGLAEALLHAEGLEQPAVVGEPESAVVLVGGVAVDEIGVDPAGEGTLQRGERVSRLDRYANLAGGLGERLRPSHRPLYERVIDVEEDVAGSAHAAVILGKKAPAEARR